MAKKGQLDCDGRVIPQELMEAAEFAASQHLPEPVMLDGSAIPSWVLVCGVIEQESRWKRSAYRYEGAFQKKYVDKINGLSATEKNGRASSWGLMQLMGQVARERGFAGDFPDLCVLPSENLRFGCLHLRNMLARADGDVRNALLDWNGRGNPNYADEVMQRMRRYKAAP